MLDVQKNYLDFKSQEVHLRRGSSIKIMAAKGQIELQDQTIPFEKRTNDNFGIRVAVKKDSYLLVVVIIAPSSSFFIVIA